MAALVATSLVVVLAAPSGAQAAPQGPWILPAKDLATGDGALANPQVAVAADGTTTVVWQRGSNSGNDRSVQVATRPPGGAFAAPVDLSPPGQDCHDPQIVVAADGTATVLWAIDYNDFQVATRLPGSSFGAPVSVDVPAPGGNSILPRMVSTPGGAVTVIWDQIVPPDTQYAAYLSTRSPGGEFTVPAAIPGGERAGSLTLAANLDGGVTIAWAKPNDNRSNIQTVDRLPDGTFTEPVDLSDVGDNADFPKIAVAPDGTATVIWKLFAEFGNAATIQAATRPPGGAFAAPVAVSSVGPVDGVDEAQIAVGADGKTTVGWQQLIDGPSRLIGFQIATRPPGGEFTAPKNIVPASDKAMPLAPQFAIAPDGSATFVWALTDGVSYSTAQSTTTLPDGTSRATKDLSTQGTQGPSITREVAVAIGPDGRATAVWDQNDGTDFTIQSASTGAPEYFDLSLTRSGSGQGKVTSAPAGIECGASCSKEFFFDTEVTLTATADPGSSFTGWGGACAGTSPTCVVTMSEARAVTAGFDQSPTPPPPPGCEQATFKLIKFKQHRRKGTGTLRVKAGMAGKVILKGSKRVKRSVKTLKHKGTVALKVKAKGKAAKQLKRRGKVKVKIKVSFRPAGDCKAKTRNRTVKLVK